MHINTASFFLLYMYIVLTLSEGGFSHGIPIWRRFIGSAKLELTLTSMQQSATCVANCRVIEAIVKRWRLLVHFSPKETVSSVIDRCFESLSFFLHDWMLRGIAFYTRRARARRGVHERIAHAHNLTTRKCLVPNIIQHA